MALMCRGGRLGKRVDKGVNVEIVDGVPDVVVESEGCAGLVTY